MANGPAPTAPSPRPGAQVLLVSNDTDVVRHVAESAAPLSISLELCADAAEAVPLLSQRKFEAVIVDLDLGQPGYATLEQVRISPRNRTAVTFMITSSNPEGTSPLKTGSSFVLQRPLSRESIDRTLRAAYGMIVRELRRSFRCPIAVPAVVQRSGEPDAFCQTLDISEGGLGVNAPLTLEPGTQVTIEFTLPGRTASFRAAAEMCWCDSNGRMGVRFLNLAASQRSELQGWLSTRLEKILPEGVVERFRVSST